MTKIKNINKIILLVCAMIISPSYSLDMCAENDSVVVVLDPNIGGSNSSYHTNTQTFKVIFSYGTLTGVSACLTTSHSQGETYKYVLKENGQIVVGGELNGTNCWCKITHPVNTLWFRYISYTSSAGCGAVCPAECKNLISGNTDYRKKLFDTIGQY